MELKHSDRIWFNEEQHAYLLDDEKMLCGVTTLLKKHNLGADYTNIPEATLLKAAEIGHELHKEIQDYLAGISIFSTDLTDDVKQLNLKFVEAESIVSDFDMIASAIDLVCEGSAPDKAILIDIKSTEKMHRRMLDFQLGIYRYLFERMNPEIKVEGLYCLLVDKHKRRMKGFYPVNGVSAEEVEALLDCERKGLIYVDENNVPDISDALQPDEAYDLVNNAGKIAELENTIKALKETSEKVRDKLLDYMEKNNLESVSFPGGSFKRKAAYTTTRIDSDALKKLFPSVYERVQKTSKVRASLTYKPNNQ